MLLARVGHLHIGIVILRKLVGFNVRVNQFSVPLAPVIDKLILYVVRLVH
jgi:hypothetical protein